MIQYAILLNPGHNRVYFEASKKLSIAELEIVAKSFSMKCDNFLGKEIGGVYYIIFNASAELNMEDFKLISKLSFIYALFEIKNIKDELLLLPIQKMSPYYFNDDISMILKYSGKTNEIFTKLLLNIAICASDFNDTMKINFLDPVAGKGTSLFEGLISGYNCYGVEISPDAVHDGVVYLKKYLENAKYKHTYEKLKLSGENKSFKAEMNNFTIAKNKEDFKSGNTLSFSLATGDSRYTDKIFRKDFFHLIVGDLPYGVQHGNVSNQKQASFTRNPSELLNVCLPGWIDSLKRGGTIVLAWNKFVLSREDMEKILTEKKLKVLNDYPYDQLEHRVDQSIKRDIIVAKKL